MAITGLQLVPVEGQFLYLNASPAVGTIQFTPDVNRLVNAEADEIVVASVFTVTLDEEGSFSTTLPATNDPDFLPAGWTFTVEEFIAGAPGRTYSIEIPYDTEGTLNLADVAPVGPSSGAPAYVLATEYAALETRVLELEVNPANPITGIPDVPGLPEALDIISDTANNAIPYEEKGQPSGVASLDGDGKVPSSQIPSLAIGDVFVVNSEAAMLTLSAQSGDVAIRTDFDPDRTYMLTNDTPGTLANWAQLTTTGAVVSVNGQTGVVSLTPVMLGATTLGAALFGAADDAAARALLDLGNAAQFDIGQTAFTLAQGNDPRFTQVGTDRQTGTTYTVALANLGRAIEMNNAGANAVTVPNNTSVAIPVGSTFEVGQYGAGTTSILRASGVVFRGEGIGDQDLVIVGRYGTVSFRKIGTNEFWVTGAYER